MTDHHAEQAIDRLFQISEHIDSEQGIIDRLEKLCGERLKDKVWELGIVARTVARPAMIIAMF